MCAYSRRWSWRRAGGVPDQRRWRSPTRSSASGNPSGSFSPIDRRSIMRSAARTARPTAVDAAGQTKLSARSRAAYGGRSPLAKSHTRARTRAIAAEGPQSPACCLSLLRSPDRCVKADAGKHRQTKRQGNERSAPPRVADERDLVQELIGGPENAGRQSNQYCNGKSGHLRPPPSSGDSSY